MSRILQPLLACLCLQIGTGLSAGEATATAMARTEPSRTANPRLMLVNWENQVLASARNSTLGESTSPALPRALPRRERTDASFDGMGIQARDAFEHATVAGSLARQEDGYIRIRSQNATPGPSSNTLMAGAASGWFAGSKSHPGTSEDDLRPGVDEGMPAPLAWMLALGALVCLWLIGRELLA